MTVVSTARAPSTLVEAFTARVAASPGAAFLIALAGEEVTYEVADRRTEAVARSLAAAGIEPGHRVGLYLPNAPAWPIASLAVWRVGGSVVACGTLLAAREALAAFVQAGADVVVTTKPEALRDSPVRVIAVDDVGAVGGAPPETAPAVVSVPPRDEAVVFFTSGTTGDPKGVPHTHGDIIAWARQVAGAYARSDAFRPTTAPRRVAPGVIFTPFGHIGGYLSLAFRLWIGRGVVLVPKFSPEAVAALLDRYPLNALQLTPTMVHMLAHAADDLPLDRLRYVTSSTAPLAAATREAFERRYGIPIVQAYGMTEAGTISQERYEDVQAGRRPPNSVGRPADGVRVRILADDGSDLPTGAEGEIVVSSPTVVASYTGGAAAQAQNGWFHTGDVGHLDDDGFLYITGRLSDKLIVGGFNVYPAEVEDVLRRSPHVTDAAVVGLPDDRLGERPAAAVVWAGEPQVDLLREEARAALAHYKVPRDWVGVERIPLTARGKVDRIRLRARIEERLA